MDEDWATLHWVARKFRARALRVTPLSVGLVGVALAACGQPNPKINHESEPATRTAVEPDPVLTGEVKIRQLIAAVRKSELTFVQDEIERTGTAAADKLQLLLDRDVDGVRSAQEFIVTIAAPTREEEPDVVILGPERTMLAREWYERQLAKIEGEVYQPGAVAAAAERARAERSGKRMRILDALIIVERSPSTFVVPARRAPPKPKPKPPGSEKRKLFKKRSPRSREYTGGEFADMLRKKWEFLGADIDELEPFITEIATESFASLEPYRVRHADGATESFETWLRSELEKQRVAQGG